MRRGLGAAALAALLAAGCQASGTMTGENVQTFYHPGLVGYVARDGALPLAAFGQPFQPGTDVAAALQAGLMPPAGSGASRFAATPAAHAGEGGRVVLAFDGPSDGAALCRLPQGAASAGADGGKVRVMAAFCLGDDVASEVQLVTQRPGSPDDPAFRRELQTMLIRLLPDHAPGQTGDCPPADRC